MEKSRPAPATPATEAAAGWRRLAWFVGLWAAGVAVFGLLSYGLRALLF
ncbi:DUF2474 domain-containing protein [Sinimarinibacterium thermocellulolyticum]|uniref:DUF2474 domain-containing protein n=1 Tax=Sinimarinibacterium thermocellulolyticum TaxID=3170016 RepID=A0ABV2A836_9GAMM